MYFLNLNKNKVAFLFLTSVHKYIIHWRWMLLPIIHATNWLFQGGIQFHCCIVINNLNFKVNTRGKMGLQYASQLGGLSIYITLVGWPNQHKIINFPRESFNSHMVMGWNLWKSFMPLKQNAIQQPNCYYSYPTTI